MNSGGVRLDVSSDLFSLNLVSSGKAKTKKRKQVLLIMYRLKERMTSIRTRSASSHDTIK